MAKYTIQELIDILDMFPKDLRIGTHLAFMITYPENLAAYKDGMTPQQWDRLTRENADEVYIFEGTWRDPPNTISNLEGDYERVLDERREE